ncbi:MAG TPA: hypothetical protein VLL72_05745 [Kiloniellales bacterium]|nr:hypothetical protein [Kiloniellales bacterium]
MFALALLGATSAAFAGELYFGTARDGGPGGSYAPAENYAYDRAFGYSKPYRLDRRYGYGQPRRRMPEARFTAPGARDLPAAALRAEIRALEARIRAETPPPPRRKPGTTPEAAENTRPAAPDAAAESR